MKYILLSLSLLVALVIQAADVYSGIDRGVIILPERVFDQSRIYLGGFSMGGADTWTCAFESRHPLAAISPMASAVSHRAKIHYLD
jgi:predicted peptidase